MARRRLNIKFLVILGSAVVVLAGGFVALDAYRLKRFFFKVDWTTFRNAALADESRGDWEAATGDWSRAINTKPAADPELRVSLGDAFNHLTTKDRDNLRRAVMMWEQALQVDPSYLPAMERLLVYRREEVQVIPKAAAFEQLRTLAERILALDSKHKEAGYVAAMAVIEGWMLGMETGNERVDRAAETLARVAIEDPANADIPRYLASVKMGRAQDAIKYNDRSGAIKLFGDAQKIVQEKADERPADPAVLFNAARTLYALIAVDLVTGNTLQYSEQLLKYVEKADAAVKTSDPLYVDVRALHARILETQRNDPKGAEEIYRDVLQNKPSEQPVRIALAELIGRNTARRQEAIDLLNQPLPDDNTFIGLRGLLRSDWEIRTLMSRANLQLDEIFLRRSDGKPTDALTANVDDTYAKVAAKAGENHAQILRIKGRISESKGQAVEAIQTYGRALGLMSATERGETRDRLELTYMLARAYAATRQTGEAKALLTDLVAQSPRFLPGRLLLINVLLDERNTAEARRNIEYLEKNAPDIAVLPNLQIAALDPVKDREKIGKLYEKLPENTRGQMIEKARIAQRVERPQEAERLLVTLRTNNRADAELANLLARVYMAQDQRDKALAVFDDAIAADPKSPVLPMLLSRLKGESPRNLVRDIADPFQRALASAQVAISDASYSEALKQLKIAEALKPDDNRVLDLLFRSYVAFKDWDQAAPVVERLAKNNADNASGLIYRGRLALSRNDLSRASAYATQLVKEYPEFSQSWLMLAQTYQAQRKFEEAVANYQLALNKQTQNFDALQGMVESNLALGKQDDAKRFIDEALRLDPASVTFAMMKTEWQLRFGKPEDVLAERQAALKENPAERKNWLSLTSVYRAMARNLASSNQDAEGAAYLAKARDTLGEALAKFPSDLELATQFADLCQQTGSPDDGERALAGLAAASPEDISAPMALADFQVHADRLADAEKTLRATIVATGAKPPIQLRLAALLNQQGKVDDAVAVLNDNADQPSIMRQRVDILINARRADQADQAITRAAAGKELTPELKNLRALVYLNQGKTEEALKLLEDVLVKDPRDSFALFYRSLVRLRTGTGNLDVVIRDLSTVRDGLPSLIDARLALVEAYRKRNDSESAIRELESASRQAPENRNLILTLLDAYFTAKPPRWNAAERLLQDARAIPRLAGDPDLYHAEAKMWLDRKDAAQSVEAASKALAKRPGNPDYLRTQFAGMLLGKQSERIISDSEPLLQSQPQLWWLHQFRAVAFRHLNDRARAMEEIQAALAAVLPLGDWNGVGQVLQVVKTEIGVDEFLKATQSRLGSDARLKIVIARLQEEQQNIQSALDLNEQSLKEGTGLSPVDRAIALRAVVRLAMATEPQHPDKAVAALRDLVAIDASDVAGLNDLSNMLLNPGTLQNLTQGLDFATRAQQALKAAGGSSAAVDDTYGWALILNGRVDEGIAVVQLALSKTDFADGNFHLAEAYLKLKRPQDADKALSRAYDLIQQRQQIGEKTDPILRNMMDDLRGRIKLGA